MPKVSVAGTTRQPHKHTPLTRMPQAQPPVVSSSPGDLVQRALADPAALSPSEVAALQRAVGNRAVQRLLHRPEPPEAPAPGDLIQAKLMVGPASDIYEQEADAMASDVVRAISAPQAGAAVQRAVNRPDSEPLGNEEEERPRFSSRRTEAAGPAARTRREDEEGKIQLMPDASRTVRAAGGEVDQPIETGLQRARGGGRPLHGAVRDSMEAAFQADFSRVRVHSNHQSDRLNRTLSARAFTTGQDVFFKQGEYSPYTIAGQTLLAHELTHVVQQNGAAVRRKPNQQAGGPGALKQVSGRTPDARAQRLTWDYASQERKKWKERNTAAKIALAPFGALYGAGKGAMQDYQGIYTALGGDKKPSRWKMLGAGVLGTLALPFTLGWWALRGAVSGLANPLISGATRLSGFVGRIRTTIRQGVGNFRALPANQRGAVEGASPMAETAEERRSRLTALMGRRGPLQVPLPGADQPRAADDVGLTRSDNSIASGALDIGGYAATGLGAAAAGARSLTGWSSGATDANFGSNLAGATDAFGTLGAAAGVAGAGAALLDVRTGYKLAADASQQGSDRALGLGQGLASTGDALKQSATAAFNIASLSGNAAAAAAATVVAGGASVAMGVIDVLRGSAGAFTADKRYEALLAIIAETEREATLTEVEKLRIIAAARQAAATQKTRMRTGGMTALKGTITIAGGAILIAAGLTNPVGWALLGGAALVGGIYALYKLKEKSKHKRQVATRELGIQWWRARWKAKKKSVEGTSDWGSQPRRDRMKREVGEDPLDITLRSQGYESPGHFYAQYIKTTAQTLYDNAVAGEAPNPQRQEDDVRGQMVKVIEAMGLRIDRTKRPHTPTVKRIAQSLDN